MNGGMSQVDTFDPKPMLDRYHGHPMPGGPPKTERKTGSLMKSPFSFRRCGKSGIEVSEIFPRIGGRIDDLCVIRSMYTDIPNHEPSLQMMNELRREPPEPAVDGFVADLRTWNRKPESAGIRRDVSRDAGGRVAAVEFEFSARHFPGRSHPEQRQGPARDDPAPARLGAYT
jgi:hypothetical protein